MINHASENKSDLKTADTGQEQLLKWVSEAQALCKPKEISWCNGSKEEYDRLCVFIS